MNRLAVRTLLAFLAALLVLVAALAASSLLGIRRSLGEWDRARQEQLGTLAEEILRERPHTAEVRVPDNAPLFVYDVEGTLVFSNRAEPGQGRRDSRGGGRSAAGTLTAVHANGTLVGTYRTGDMQFRNDSANRRFIDSLRGSLWLGLGLAFIISVPFALLFARSLSAPAVRVARSLDRITGGELGLMVPETGADEIALIARSVNRLAQQLAREQQLRRQWIHDVTHDLRTPVAALKAQFEGMQDGVLDRSAERIGRNILEIERIESLVANLEELMRLESPALHLSGKSFDPATLIDELRERFAPGIAERGIVIETRLSSGPFSADPLLLHRALTNILSNAVRHCPDGGRIEVAVSRAGPAVRLSVFNTGEQVPVGDLPKVFDRLFRGEYARHTPGSGLGLTIARRIVELHGGEIRITNLVDGVCVDMVLPQE